jgi:hypothetical protein
VGAGSIGAFSARSAAKVGAGEVANIAAATINITLSTDSQRVLNGFIGTSFKCGAIIPKNPGSPEARVTRSKIEYGELLALDASPLGEGSLIIFLVLLCHFNLEQN